MTDRHNLPVTASLRSAPLPHPETHPFMHQDLDRQLPHKLQAWPPTGQPFHSDQNLLSILARELLPQLLKELLPNSGPVSLLILLEELAPNLAPQLLPTGDQIYIEMRF